MHRSKRTQDVAPGSGEVTHVRSFSPYSFAPRHRATHPSTRLIACSHRTILATSSVCFAVFATELLLRCASVPKFRWLVLDIFVWIDVIPLVAVVARFALWPSERLDAHDQSAGHTLLCLMEAVGPLRLLKVSRYLRDAQMLKAALADAMNSLGVPFFIYLVTCIGGGSVIYVFELTSDSVPDFRRPDQDHRVQNVFQYILDVATLTLVGFASDTFSAQSTGSRFVVVIVSTLGLVVIALCLTIVSTSFHRVWANRDVDWVRMGLRRLAAANGASSRDIFEAFQQFDRDGSGNIDFDEFKHMLLDWLQLPMPPMRLRELFLSMDRDDSGEIDYNEFLMRVYPELEVDLGSAASKDNQGIFRGLSDLAVAAASSAAHAASSAAHAADAAAHAAAHSVLELAPGATHAASNAAHATDAAVHAAVHSALGGASALVGTAAGAVAHRSHGHHHEKTDSSHGFRRCVDNVRVRAAPPPSPELAAHFTALNERLDRMEQMFTETLAAMRPPALPSPSESKGGAVEMAVAVETTSVSAEE